MASDMRSRAALAGLVAAMLSPVPWVLPFVRAWPPVQRPHGVVAPNLLELLLFASVAAFVLDTFALDEMLVPY